MDDHILNNSTTRLHICQNSLEPRFARHQLEISSFLGKLLCNKHLYYNFTISIICIHLTVASRCSAPFRHLLKSIPNVPVNSKPLIYIIISSVCQSDSNFCQNIDFLLFGGLCSERNAFLRTAGP